MPAYVMLHSGKQIQPSFVKLTPDFSKPSLIAIFVAAIGSRAPRSKSMIVRSPTPETSASSFRESPAPTLAARHWAAVMFIFLAYIFIYIVDVMMLKYYV